MRRKIVLVALFAVLAPTSAFAQSSSQLANVAANLAASKHVLNKPSSVVALHNIIGNNIANIQSLRQQEIDRIRKILRNLHRPRPCSP